MPLINSLAMKDSETPGRMLQLFEFQGICWEINPVSPRGQSFLTPTTQPQTILILAKNAWMAHTFLKVHIPSMLPDKVTCLGKVWFAPDIQEDDWTPPEYEEEEGPPIMVSNTARKEMEKMTLVQPKEQENGSS